ncbi:MAG: YebC/PmpR family DNA-binding transcriptional regulator [Candidatus Hydrothermales bacterium]
MAGHSKWAQIKHKKAKADIQKGKIFNKLIREIQIAAKLGGGDPDNNPRLRLAIERARDHNMPWDNIEKAIKRGTGEIEGLKYEEVVYEGYGPAGVAIFIRATTDNKNRTTSEIRHLFTKHGGNLGTTGSVRWQFEEKGVLHVRKDIIDEEKLIEIALEVGAEDVKTEGEYFDIYTSPSQFLNVKESLKKLGIEAEGSIHMIPKNQVKVQGKEAERLISLLNSLEEHDDVQEVVANFEMSEEEFSKLVGSA